MFHKKTNTLKRSINSLSDPSPSVSDMVTSENQELRWQKTEPMNLTEKLHHISTVQQDLERGLIGPEEALDRVSFAVNTLVDYQNFPSDSYMGWMALIAASKALDSIPNRQSLEIFDMGVDSYSNVLELKAKHDIIDRYNSYSQGVELVGDPSYLEDDTNSVGASAICALVAEEQLNRGSARSRFSFEESVLNDELTFDTDLIIGVRDAVEVFNSAHANSSIDKEELNEAGIKLNSILIWLDAEYTENELPVTRSIVQRFIAQTAYDLSWSIDDHSERKVHQEGAVNLLGEALGLVGNIERDKKSDSAVRVLEITHGKISYFHDSYQEALDKSSPESTKIKEPHAV